MTNILKFQTKQDKAKAERLSLTFMCKQIFLMTEVFGIVLAHKLLGVKKLFGMNGGRGMKKCRQRDCDACTRQWEDAETKPGYVQYIEDGEWEICGMCNGTALIDDTCYCHARYSGECCCDYGGWDE